MKKNIVILCLSIINIILIILIPIIKLNKNKVKIKNIPENQLEKLVASATNLPNLIPNKELQAVQRSFGLRYFEIPVPEKFQSPNSYFCFKYGNKIISESPIIMRESKLKIVLQGLFGYNRVSFCTVNRTSVYSFKIKNIKDPNFNFFDRELKKDKNSEKYTLFSVKPTTWIQISHKNEKNMIGVKNTKPIEFTLNFYKKNE